MIVRTCALCLSWQCGYKMEVVCLSVSIMRRQSASIKDVAFRHEMWYLSFVLSFRYDCFTFPHRARCVLANSVHDAPTRSLPRRRNRFFFQISIPPESYSCETKFQNRFVCLGGPFPRKPGCWTLHPTTESNSTFRCPTIPSTIRSVVRRFNSETVLVNGLSTAVSPSRALSVVGDGCSCSMAKSCAFFRLATTKNELSC